MRTCHTTPQCLISLQLMPGAELNNSLDFATIFGIIFMFNAAVSWLVFTQLGMRPLEKTKSNKQRYN